MDEDLPAIAARMRAYAFEHPMDAMACLTNPRAAEQYSHDFIYEGFCLRVIFSFLQLSKLDVLQLSIANRPEPRALPPELVDRIRDSFFSPEEIVNMIRKDVRNDMASLIGRPRIAEDKTEHFICAKKRKGVPNAR